MPKCSFSCRVSWRFGERETLLSYHDWGKHQPLRMSLASCRWYRRVALSSRPTSPIFPFRPCRLACNVLSHGHRPRPPRANQGASARSSSTCRSRMRIEPSAQRQRARVGACRQSSDQPTSGWRAGETSGDDGHAGEGRRQRQHATSRVAAHQYAGSRRPTAPTRSRRQTVDGFRACEPSNRQSAEARYEAETRAADSHQYATPDEMMGHRIERRRIA